MKDKNTDIGLLILRVSISVLMILHGVSKIVHGLGGIEGMLANIGLPSFIAYGSLVGEIVAPLFIIAGFRTRLAALVLAFNMIVAVLMVHTGHFFALTETGGWAVELPALYFFPALVLFFTGAGKYAVSTKSIWD